MATRKRVKARRGRPRSPKRPFLIRMLPGTKSTLVAQAKRSSLRLGDWLDEMAMARRILEESSDKDLAKADIERCFGRAVVDATERLKEAYELFDIDPSSAGRHRTSLQKLNKVYKNLVDFIRHEGYWHEKSRIFRHRSTRPAASRRAVQPRRPQIGP